MFSLQALMTLAALQSYSTTGTGIDMGKARPIRQAPYRQPIHRKAAAGKGATEDERGWCRCPIQEPMGIASLVPKKDGSTRFCVDLRTPHPVCRWVRVRVRVNLAGAFGLGNAPATFERLMETIHEGLPKSACLVYLDDLLIYASTFEQELTNLRDVLGRLQQANLKQFFQCQTLFLGPIVSGAGIATNPEKVKAVAKWPHGSLHGFMEMRMPFLAAHVWRPTACTLSYGIRDRKSYRKGITNCMLWRSFQRGWRG